MRRILYVVGFVLALATPAAAQQERTFTASHLAAARDYLGVVQNEQMAMAAAEAMLDQRLHAYPEMARFRETIMAWTRELFAAPEARNALAELQAETFTEADLRALTTFWGAPLGQRYLKAQPALREGGIPALRARGFTEAELRRLAAFFATPLGQRYTSRSPVVQRRALELGQQLVNARRSELEARIDSVLSAQPAP